MLRRPWPGRCRRATDDGVAGDATRGGPLLELRWLPCSLRFGALLHRARGRGREDGARRAAAAEGEHERRAAPLLPARGPPAMACLRLCSAARRQGGRRARMHSGPRAPPDPGGHGGSGHDVCSRPSVVCCRPCCAPSAAGPRTRRPRRWTPWRRGRRGAVLASSPSSVGGRAGAAPGRPEVSTAAGLREAPGRSRARRRPPLSYRVHGGSAPAERARPSSSLHLTLPPSRRGSGSTA
ncbi:hypothetical protein PVAP13_3NG128333 [Panicum virgatum]|uniref:Uncharacterized protein n=1 Tax=Panicum virgatum TaxID=38727 RepID=A0A8T0U527_PANVG|nr:hypothetical protein PVAP13_3NG128333 [Panicum virgatum]